MFIFTKYIIEEKLNLKGFLFTSNIKNRYIILWKNIYHFNNYFNYHCDNWQIYRKKLLTL